MVALFKICRQDRFRELYAHALRTVASICCVEEGIDQLDKVGGRGTRVHVPLWYLTRFPGYRGVISWLAVTMATAERTPTHRCPFRKVHARVSLEQRTFMFGPDASICGL